MTDKNMWLIEDSLYAQGIGMICGVDEAGRGPLAGPVVAGAVILPATPSFYSLPKDIEAVCQTVTERITAMLGIEGKRYEWGRVKQM